MHVVDRRLLYLWLLITLGAGCAIFLPGMVILLMLTLIGIPLAWLIALMPGAWIYFTPTLTIYTILRRVSGRTPRLAMFAAAATLPLAVGFGIPLWANAVTEQRVQALIAQDHGAPPTLPANLSVTHAIDRGLGSSGKCWDICQRLLFSRTAKSFIEVPLDMLSKQASLPTSARRFSLGPIGDATTRGYKRRMPRPQKLGAKSHPRRRRSRTNWRTLRGRDCVCMTMRCGMRAPMSSSSNGGTTIRSSRLPLRR